MLPPPPPAVVAAGAGGAPNRLPPGAAGAPKDVTGADCCAAPNEPTVGTGAPNVEEGAGAPKPAEIIKREQSKEKGVCEPKIDSR